MHRTEAMAKIEGLVGDEICFTVDDGYPFCVHILS